VELSGPEDAPALVGLHGGPGIGDCRDMARELAPLADAHRLLVYDARGSGRSADVEPYTHAQWAADLDALTRSVGIETFALLGHSYGGIMAQEFALAYPQRLDRLILVDTSPRTVDDDASIANALAADLPGIEEGWLRELFEGRVPSDEQFRAWWELMLPLYFEDGLSPEAAHELAGQVWFHHATHNHAFAVNNPNFDVRERLQEIAVTTLVVCGANDWITPRALSEDIAARIPGARLEIFEHSGHMPMLEETERFLALVRSFLAAPPQSGRARPASAIIASPVTHTGV
jgi:proline iminopeptidase